MPLKSVSCIVKSITTVNIVLLLISNYLLVNGLYFVAVDVISRLLSVSVRNYY